jgi:hypothetical protein
MSGGVPGVAWVASLSLLDNQPHHLSLTDVQPRLAFEHFAHLHTVELLVALRPRTPHRRPARSVQQPELNPHGVGHFAHHAAQRVHLADQMAFGHAADSRIATHLRNQVHVHGDERRLQAHARGRHRRLAPGVARANHHHIVLFRKGHPVPKKHR